MDKPHLPPVPFDDVPDPRQIEAWRRMTGAERLEIAFQLYQMALDAVRANERTRHPDLSEEELNWRVTRRMQGDPTLGEHEHGAATRTGTSVIPRAS